MKATLAIAVLLALPAQEASSPDGEGFIRNWLVLAPIPIEEGSGGVEIDKQLIENEAKIKPKAGDKQKAEGKELVWTAHKSAEFFIDFLAAFGKDRGEDVCAYAVAYVTADEETKVKLAIGSNDQVKAFVNGKEIAKFTETRTLEKDTETAEVTLTKGQNVLVLKVINEKNNWQGCARFLKDGAPVKNIKISLTPN
jgi:hypothetical protein